MQAVLRDRDAGFGGCALVPRVLTADTARQVAGDWSGGVGSPGVPSRDLRGRLRRSGDCSFQGPLPSRALQCGPVL